MMALELTDTELPRLIPQDIIDLILDEVAALKSPATLGACALVSKSFYIPCQRHLYSDIILVIDKWGEARARRLIRTLETLQKRGCTTPVRSLTLILDVSSRPTPGSRFLGRKSQKFNRVRVSLWGTSLEKLLKLLMAGQLTRFALEARGGFIDWELHLKGEIRMEIFHTLFTHPSLKSMDISHVSGLDKSLVMEAFRSNFLEELSFINVSIPMPYQYIGVVQLTKSHLRKLDIRRTSIREFLRIIGYAALPISTPHPFMTFPQLQSLIILGRSWDLDLWRFILGFARTLETLEIEELYWQEDYVCLDQLTSLRSLKIVTTSFGSDSRLDIKQAQVCHLLSSATSPTGIQHISLQFNVQMLPQMSYPSCSDWTELDKILSGIAFVDLSRLEVRLHFVYTANDKGNGSVCDISESGLLPHLASNSSVEYRLEERTIYTPLYMPEYLHYSV